MTEEALDLSSELAVELAANNVVDPRTVPVRFSALKRMAQSPAHYFHACQDLHEETLSMRLGSGAHAILFNQDLKVWPGRRAGKDWEAFKREAGTTPIVNAREYVEACNMADSVRRCESAQKLFDHSVILETPIHWQFMGRACRSTPDMYNAKFVVELKTSRSSEPDRFARQGFWMSYHAQLAFYMDAVRASGFGAPFEAYVIAVESSPPYPVTVLRLTERALDQGRKLCRLWFERLLQCEAANEWPGYCQSIVDMDLSDADEGPALVFGEENAP